MKQEPERFWNVDLVELFNVWFADLGTFAMTVLTFIGMAIPVIIPILILWYLYSIDFQVKP